MTPNKKEIRLKNMGGIPILAEIWTVNSKFHRLDGPAYTIKNLETGEIDDEEYYINGKSYSKEEFNNFVKGLDNKEEKELLGDLGQSFE